MKIRKMVTIKGLVQGVNFRYYTQKTARGLNVSGWVRNVPDGSVAGCFEGQESAVNAIIDWCRQGPASALVSEVLVETAAFSGEFDDFQISR